MLIRGDIMETKKFEAEYTYDFHLDVVNIEIKKEYVHKKSIDLAFGVFLDFDDNCLPVNLEIVSASKIIGVEKESLVNPDGDVTIVIGEDLVKVDVAFKFKDNDECLHLTALNDFDFPMSQTSFALV